MTTIEKLLTFAEQHGEDAEWQHHAADLEDMLRASWGLLHPALQLVFLQSDELESMVEACSTGKVPVEAIIAEWQSLARINETKRSMDRLITLTQAHGDDEGLETQVGDLEQMLRSIWAKLNLSERRAFLRSPSVASVVEGGGRGEVYIDALIKDAEEEYNHGS